MSNFAERITDALDILKYDGAVQDTLAELRKKWGLRSRCCWTGGLMRWVCNICSFPTKKGRRLWGRNCPPSAGRCTIWTGRTSTCLS